MWAKSKRNATHPCLRDDLPAAKGHPFYMGPSAASQESLDREGQGANKCLVGVRSVWRCMGQRGVRTMGVGNFAVQLAVLDAVLLRGEPPEATVHQVVLLDQSVHLLALVLLLPESPTTKPTLACFCLRAICATCHDVTCLCTD